MKSAGRVLDGAMKKSRHIDAETGATMTCGPIMVLKARTAPLWPYLCRKLEKLDDNNLTARRIYDYVDKLRNRGEFDREY